MTNDRNDARPDPPPADATGSGDSLLRDVAEFLDGSADADDRRRLIERLDRDDDAYRTFLEAAAIHDDSRLARAPKVNARPWRRHSPFLTVGAGVVAALVALVVAGPLLRSDDPVEGGLDYIVSRGALPLGSADPDWSRVEWREVRSGAGGLLADDQRAFRTGVRLVDLEAAVRVDDRPRGTSLLHGLVALHADPDAPAGVAAVLRADSARVADTGLQVLDLASLRDVVRAGYDSEWVDAGLHLEVARLTLIRATGELRAAVRALDVLRSAAALELPTAVAEQIRTLSAAPAPATAGDLTALRSRLEALIVTLGG